MNKNVRGFTLIEIMVVIIIIAVLATASVWSYAAYTVRARNTARTTAAKSYIDILGIMYGRDPSALYQKNTSGSDIRFCLGTWFSDVNSNGVGDCYVLNASDPLFTQVDSSRTTSMQAVTAQLPDSTHSPILGSNGKSYVGPVAVIKSSDGLPWVRYILETAGTSTCPFGNVVTPALDPKVLVCEDVVNVSTAP